MPVISAEHQEAERLEGELRRQISEFYGDPLSFAKFSYPWGQPGPYEKYAGPCPCQIKVLTVLGEEVRKRLFDGVHPVAPIRIAVSSGHGIGKSALAAMIVDWIMSTRGWCQGTVTANTNTQLETKTWAQIQHWTKYCITKHWFTVNSTRFYQNESKEKWFFSPQTCREENSEAFAGQHAANSSSVYINDEASAIPDAIFDVQEGGLTDGEPIQILFGNPTKSTGKFYRATQGSERHRYIHIVIDSRDCPLTNKEQIAEWVHEYGEDSDFVRVRVRGLPPRAADSQFIDSELVKAAQIREPMALADDPLVCGVDLAWGGDDFNTIRFRRGNDAKSILPIKIPGEKTRTPDLMVAKLAEILGKEFDGRRVGMMFMDAAGIAGPVARRLREMGHKNVLEVNFGAHSPDEKHAFMRSYMWGQLKAALPSLAIDRSPDLEEDLTAPGYKIDKQTRIQLEPKDKIKERIGRSTDDGDALALTYAAPVRRMYQEGVYLPPLFGERDLVPRGVWS